MLLGTATILFGTALTTGVLDFRRRASPRPRGSEGLNPD